MENPFELLINKELESVVFIRDYIQLLFEGPKITIISRLSIIVNNRVINAHSNKYFQTLINCIDEKVTSTEMKENSKVNLWFSNGVGFQMSLNPEDSRDGESLHLFDGKGGYWFY